MRSVFTVLLMSLLCGAVTYAHSADQVPYGPDTVKGKYVGKLEIYTGRRTLTYDYALSIFAFDTDKQEVSLKTECNECEGSKSSTLKGCKISENGAVLVFSCKGEMWSVDYRLEGDHLKGTGITKKGSPITVSVTKEQKK